MLKQKKTILQTKPEKDTPDLEIKLLDENNFSNKFNPEIISNITNKGEEQQQTIQTVSEKDNIAK